MTDFEQTERLDPSHDPILRLDQFIHRQDLLIKIARAQLKLTQALIVLCGISAFLLFLLLIMKIL